MEKSRKSDSTMNRMDSNQDNDTGQLGPGASFTVFILMEDLIDRWNYSNTRPSLLKNSTSNLFQGNYTDSLLF